MPQMQPLKQNKAKKHELGGLNNTKFYFLTILEARSPRTMKQPLLFLVSALFVGCRLSVSSQGSSVYVCVVAGGENREDLSGISYYKGTNPTMRFYLHDLI